MERIIDMTNKSVDEHYKLVKELKADGFYWWKSTFHNPSFVNKEGEVVTIIAGIIEQDGYFSYD